MALKKIIFIFIGLLFVGAAINSQAQEFHVGNHPELKWYTIETKHFMVHYHKGAERTARVVAKIAEDIYLPITSLYLYEPDDKIHFVIRDHDDFSNGAAFYYDNKVEIWATPMDFILRGSHNWLRNVVTHEFTHMISLGAARKMTRSIPAIYMQYMGYEPEKNPYVLYGFPNKIVSYPIAMTIVPMWLAEGMAQFQLPGLNYDRWDSHRDMILRDATLEGELLDHKEMTVFGDNSIRNEKSYNQGYSLTQYIVDQYGLASLRRIVREMKSPFRFSVNGAIKKVLNISEKQLYKDWKTYLEKMYDYRTERIQTNLVTGEVLRDEGSADIYPVWSPDGKRYAFLSNEGEKSISKTALYVHDTESNKTKKIKDGVLHSVNWSPDGTKLIYTKYSDATKYLSHYLDIFAYDLKKKKERPITRYYRAQSPAWSPDGKSLVFVVTKDGTQNLVKLNLETKKPQYLTKFKNGEQVFTPRWSPNGNAIIVSLADRHKRNIALISADGGEMHYLIRDKHDARDPIFSPDGDYVYFSWDRTGIFNIYRMDARGKNVKQLTNVLGGAFMPSINKNGQLLYSGFSKQKYNIFQLDKPEPIDQVKTEYVEYQRNFHLASTTLHEILPLNENKADITTRNYDDTQIPNYESKPYSNLYSKMAFMPRVMIDYETTKLGTYFVSSDILDKLSLFGGVAANKDFDLDVFGIFEYRKFRPKFFLEGYYQIRHHSLMDSLIMQDSPDEPPHIEYTKFSYKYDLMEVDFGMEGLIFNEMNHLRLAYIYSRYNTKVKYNIDIFNQEATNVYTYFKGSNISLTYTFTNFLETPWFPTKINPTDKRKITLKVKQEFNQFIDDFKRTEFGSWGEVYENYNYTKFELDWNEYIGLFADGKHALNLQFMGGAILSPVHEFFNFYSGGLLGLRGYPYYSIEGRKQLIGRATYRFPISDHLNFRLFHLYFDKLYAGVFYDYGNAFDEDKIDFSQFKRNYGFELRMNLFSFYAYPTRIFFNAAYGLDKHVKYENDSKVKLTYGNEWRYYFGITFGFFN